MSTMAVKTEQIARNGSHEYSTNDDDEPQAIPTLPLHEVVTHAQEMLTLLNQGPVALAQGKQPVAVLLAVAEWNKLVDRLELLEDAVAVYKGRLDVATGKAKMHRLSPEALAEWANEPEPVLG